VENERDVERDYHPESKPAKQDVIWQWALNLMGRKGEKQTDGSL
jgi:hypothetical protein